MLKHPSLQRLQILEKWKLRKNGSTERIVV